MPFRAHPAATPSILATAIAALLTVGGAAGCTAGQVGLGDGVPGNDADGRPDGGVPGDDDGGDGPGDDDDDDGPADAGPMDGGVDAGETVEDAGPPPPPGDFAEVDGLVTFEVEHFHEQTNTEPLATVWYEISVTDRYPEVSCVTNVECGRDTRPDCNEYPTCDGDDTDPAGASGDAYLESLPDRRRDDHEAGTGGIGIVNTPGAGPTLHYRVWFENPGRYYVWGRARGQGPAANGLHIGLDGEWPRNDLIDPSTMRMQFPGGGWKWTQNRRGGRQHTGVSGTDEVSRRDANIWLQIDTPGLHTIMLSMREDGLEIDKMLMTTDPEYTPSGEGPPETTVDE